MAFRIESSYGHETVMGVNEEGKGLKRLKDKRAKGHTV